MYGKKVKLRVLFLFLLLSAIVLTVFLVLKSLEENVVYFLSPTEVKALNEIKPTLKYTKLILNENKAHQNETK